MQLALAPAITALAAGNRVLIKMSEYTPRTAAAVATLLAGLLFGEHLYGSGNGAWRWDHKRVFALLS